MLWQEEPSERPIVAPDSVDLAFDMNCQRLAVDHAYALSQAIQQALPWFADCQ
ncbi:MAG: type I-MYXAN CRISPR-associated protein Cas6/Cmx6, partial [Pseudomonadota bacterium]|nr:type I-MYXAN CRISPR-associated protein Cas6/Cmx6 [Pseudomonadota bacterium]